MDSQDSQASSLPHHLHHQFRGDHPPPRSMMVSPPPQGNSYAMSAGGNGSSSNNNNVAGHGHGHGHGAAMVQQQGRVFPFNSMVGAGGSSAADCSGGSSPRASGFSIEPAKKKRGRPRKYSPDGNIALGLSPTPVTPSSVAGHADSGGGAATAVAATPSSENPAKKIRGRPPGSVKRQLDALGISVIFFP